MTTVFNVLERELWRKVNFLKRPFMYYIRNNRTFAKNEQAGTDISSWEEAAFARSDVAGYQESSKLHTLIDYTQSKGNYVSDVDGNVLLDLCSNENRPLGHNHDDFLKVSEPINSD